MMYLTGTCCGPYYIYSDDACGSFGLPYIDCFTLSAGTYYVTIEDTLRAIAGRTR